MSGESSEVGDSPKASVLDVGLLYGRVLSGTADWLMVSGSVGLAYVLHEEPVIVGTNDSPCYTLFCDPGGPIYDETNTSTVGVPMQVRVGFQGNSFGLGFSLYGNINATQSFAGAAILLQVGDLR